MPEFNEFPHRLEFERPHLPIEISGAVRHPDCHALLQDNGIKQEIPVCMGGTAIVGCNNYDVCGEAYIERRNDRTHKMHVFSRDEEGRVKSVTVVNRAMPTTSEE